MSRAPVAPLPGTAVPVSVQWEGTDPRVTWCDFGDLPFLDPFFEDTHARLHPTGRSHTGRVTGVQALLDRAGGGRVLEPAGFVFHMGRCGSTLVSRLLASSERCRVMSEPEALVGLLDFPETLSASRRSELVRALVLSLGRPRRDAERHLVVKFTSVHVLHLQLVRQAFPHTPWVFVFREPTAVVRSLLARPTGFLEQHHTEDAAAADELVARHLLDLLTLPLEGAGADSGSDHAFIDHATLPAAVWERVAPMFGIPLDGDEIQRMRDLSGVYSKDPTGTRRHVPSDAQATASLDRLGLQPLTRHLLTQCHRELQSLAWHPARE